MQAEFWNNRYLSHETVYGDLPNAFFKQCLENLHIGRLLLPAEGEGRNAVYAATLGWEVTAFDYSHTAREKALKQAKSKDVSLSYEICDFLSYIAPNQSMDAVALIYAHIPPETRPTFHQKIANWVKPGGHVMLEAFNPLQLGLTSGGPKELNMLYTPDMLMTDFPDSEWDITMLKTLETELNEGPFHQGKAQIIRLLARRR
jgi:2-polyprenyl-3-methyl-5-hydroxy-6-metoxy-1,4-benzoquinol methylase